MRSTFPSVSCGGGSEYAPKRKLNSAQTRSRHPLTSLNSSCATCVHSIDKKGGGGGFKRDWVTECETEWTGLRCYFVSLAQHRLVSGIFTSILLPVSHTHCASLFFLPHGLTGPLKSPFTPSCPTALRTTLATSHTGRAGEVWKGHGKQKPKVSLLFLFFLPLCVPHMLVCKSESSARKSILLG